VSNSRLWVELVSFGESVYVDAQEVVSVEPILKLNPSEPSKALIKFRNSDQVLEVDGTSRDVMARIMVCNLRVAEASSPLPAVGIVRAETLDDLRVQISDEDEPMETVLGKKTPKKKDNLN